MIPEKAFEQTVGAEECWEAVDDECETGPAATIQTASCTPCR